MGQSVIISDTEIRKKIYTIRGKQVILDSDIAHFYGIETKILNQAVKRNKDRFPKEFMFQLTQIEFDFLRSQFVTANPNVVKKRFLPYVFTEQGVAMLSGILKSNIAIKISVQIMEAFVAMRHFLMENAQLFKRIGCVETKLLEHDTSIHQLFEAMQNKIPEKGIFFDGQIFDAYNFVSDLIRSADKFIILIDNYIDDSVFTLLNKRKKNVSVTIYTRTISQQLVLDLQKYNSQYPLITIKEFKNSHDRFMIIDHKEVYHFGASLKDLGKKWFAFSKFDTEAFTILNRLA